MSSPSPSPRRRMTRRVRPNTNVNAIDSILRYSSRLPHLTMIPQLTEGKKNGTKKRRVGKYHMCQSWSQCQCCIY